MALFGLLGKTGGPPASQNSIRGYDSADGRDATESHPPLLLLVALLLGQEVEAYLMVDHFRKVEAV